MSFIFLGFHMLDLLLDNRNNFKSQISTSKLKKKWNSSLKIPTLDVSRHLQGPLWGKLPLV